MSAGWRLSAPPCRTVWINISNTPSAVRPPSDRQFRPDWRRSETERYNSSAPSGNSWNTRRSRLNTLKNNRKDTLFSSGRLFSEGGDFAPQEVKLFQRRLKEESKQISVTEESIYSELEAFESSSLQRVPRLTPYLCLHDNIYTNMWQHQTLHLHSVQSLCSSSR